MRLTDVEKNIIIQSIIKYDNKAQIFLYGSRTLDKEKGGDIDLLVVSETIVFSNKVEILVNLKEQLGEQKIDLLIKKSSDLALDPFIKTIMSKAVRIDLL